MMMEVMGLHIPGAAFVYPNTKLRQELTRAAVHRLVDMGWDTNDYRPLGLCVDEKAIVNAAVGLVATGGSTNLAIHLPAIARAAGIVMDWEDLDRLSSAVPLLARIYPNGSGDVNNFHAAGGMGYVIATLLDVQFGERGPLLRTTALSGLSPTVRQAIVDRSNRIARRYAGTISDGVAEGSMRAIDPLIAAQALMALQNAAFDMRKWAGTMPGERAVAMYAGTLLFGLFDDRGIG